MNNNKQTRLFPFSVLLKSGSRTNTISESFNSSAPVIENWKLGLTKDGVRALSNNGITTDKIIVFSPEKLYRPCRVLLVNDTVYNNKHLSYLLTSIFEGCKLLCSFDICTESDVNEKLKGFFDYDILFLTKNIVSSDWFSQYYTRDNNTVIPIIVYNSKKKRPKNKRFLPYIQTKEAKTYTIGNVVISDEISFPHSLFEICSSIIRFVYIPFYHDSNLDISILENNWESIQESIKTNGCEYPDNVVGLPDCEMEHIPASNMYYVDLESIPNERRQFYAPVVRDDFIAMQPPHVPKCKLNIPLFPSEGNFSDFLFNPKAYLKDVKETTFAESKSLDLFELEELHDERDSKQNQESLFTNSISLVCSGMESVVPPLEKHLVTTSEQVERPGLDKQLLVVPSLDMQFYEYRMHSLRFSMDDNEIQYLFNRFSRIPINNLTANQLLTYEDQSSIIMSTEEALASIAKKLGAYKRIVIYVFQIAMDDPCKSEQLHTSLEFLLRCVFDKCEYFYPEPSEMPFLKFYAIHKQFSK